MQQIDLDEDESMFFLINFASEKNHFLQYLDFCLPIKEIKATSPLKKWMLEEDDSKCQNNVV